MDNKYEIYYDKDADKYILDNTIWYKLEFGRRIPDDKPDQEICILDKTTRNTYLYLYFYTDGNIKNKIALNVLCGFKAIFGFDRCENKDEPPQHVLFVIDEIKKSSDQVSYYDYFEEIHLIINTVKDELNKIFKIFLEIEIPDDVYKNGIFDVMDYIEKYDYETYWEDYLRDPDY